MSLFPTACPLNISFLRNVFTDYLARKWRVKMISITVICQSLSHFSIFLITVDEILLRLYHCQNYLCANELLHFSLSLSSGNLTSFPFQIVIVIPRTVIIADVITVVSDKIFILYIYVCVCICIYTHTYTHTYICYVL